MGMSRRMGNREAEGWKINGGITDMRGIPDMRGVPDIGHVTSVMDVIKQRARIIEDADLPIIKIHEHIKNYNSKIYNDNLAIVKNYINNKKNDEYKRYLLLKETGFDFFDNQYFVSKDEYKKALSVIKIFDYYKKKYPTLHFIYGIPDIDGYSLGEASSYTNAIPYDDLKVLNDNIKSIDYTDYRLSLYVLRSDGHSIDIKKAIGNRINVVNILKRNKIEFNFNSPMSQHINLEKEYLNKKEKLFISSRFKKIDVKFDIYQSYHPESYEYRITNNSKNYCLSMDKNFNSHNSETNNNSQETIFLKSVRGGNLITNMTGDNGSISLNRFKELVGLGGEPTLDGEGVENGYSYGEDYYNNSYD